MNNHAKCVMEIKNKEKCTLKEAWAKYKEDKPEKKSKLLKNKSY